MDSDQDCCTVNVSGLPSFSIGAFDSVQHSVGEKTGFDNVTPVSSCFSEVVASQDAVMSSVQMPVDVVSYDTSTMVTSTAQDTMLSSTQVQVAVLNVPENSIFEVVRSVPQVSDAIVGEMADIHQLTEQSQQEGEPKVHKRKGGWPKGKKRKKENPDLNKPKAPATGFVRFLNSRREELKMVHPELTFTEITKMLGIEWNQVVLPAEKQKFLDEAENDKKRYIEELKAYQQSEIYQAFVKRQQAKRVKQIDVDGSEELDGQTSLLMHNQEEDTDSNELYCLTCSLHFSSLHNKKEHMYGRQHLQMVTCEFERESGTTSNTKSSLSAPQPSTLTNHTSQVHVEIAPPLCQSSISIPQFTETFLEQNLNRELEIRELRKSILASQEHNVSLAKQIEQLKNVLGKVEQDSASSKTVGASLTAQLNSLRMVPNLFGVQLLNLQG